MELFYIAVFGVVAAAAAALELTKTKGSAAENTSREFMRFRNNYVVVYALMMGARLLVLLAGLASCRTRGPAGNRVPVGAYQFDGCLCVLRGISKKSWVDLPRGAEGV